VAASASNGFALKVNIMNGNKTITKAEMTASLANWLFTKARVHRGAMSRHIPESIVIDDMKNSMRCSDE